MPTSPDRSFERLGSDRSFAIGSSILIWLFVAINVARIVSVSADHGETPFLSANDRSRWSAIAALIEDHSFAIDRFLEKRDAKGKVRTWYSIDMVRHRDDSGVERYYSSKPPLLTVVYATATLPVMMGFQRRLSEYPMLVGRTALLLINLLPMLIFVVWWRNCIVRFVQDDNGKWLLLVGGFFGTFLFTFSNTLNNHLHAAVFLVLSLVLLHGILRERQASSEFKSFAGRNRTRIVALGFAAGCCVMCDLPALAWAGILPLVLMTRSNWFKDWCLYSLGLIPVLCAIIGVNWYAHGDWRPPYYHRENLGEQVASIALEQASAPKLSNDPHSYDDSQLSMLSASFDRADLKAQLQIQSPVAVERARRANTLRIVARDATDPSMERRYAVVRNGNQWQIHQWNDWYDYPRSYWLPENKRGVDLGEPSMAIYAWNCLFGHHGIFSLTPLFLLVVPGAINALRGGDSAVRRICLAILVVSVVCIAFYLTRNQLDRNYGGVCSGFRWQFWLIPAWLWISCFAFVSDREHFARSKWFFCMTIVALLISVFSAWYPAANPWQHPWMYQLFLHFWQ